MEFGYASDDDVTGETVTQPGGGGARSASAGGMSIAPAGDVAALASFCEGAHM